DADFCLRAAERGWRPAITPRASVVHIVGASSPTEYAKKRLLLRGKCTLLAVRWTPTRARIGRLLLAAGAGWRAMGAKVLGHVGSSPWPTLWRERRDWLRGWT